ncbi:DUF1800 domain-containing protein [Altererythrobacter sp. ZODW24]|uniref:DUF1800 domain-containing protein n=1 Tax=Altererythrobacter sp. ZODW24 TaxID=2185142 RepID=UPI000DF7F7C1|nr:DUF1800 domain-containing protein [Altererythrobacter sp. ZODW24]
MTLLHDQLTAHNRFGFGLAPGEAPAQDPRDWLRSQVGRFDPKPASLSRAKGPAPLDLLLGETGADKTERKKFYDAFRAQIADRLETARLSDTPFMERLVHFWSNHFAVSADKRATAALSAGFEFEGIRPHITGKFIDLLESAATHPAMLLYLDQSRSIGPNSSVGRSRADRQRRNSGLNENLAREILELHSMGVRSGYSQDDIEELARALTGYTVASMRGGPANTAAAGSFVFVPARHEPGTRRLLGKRFPQAGRDQARQMLQEIARQPATAEFIATKLARHFIADNPPAASIARIATAFRGSDGDLPTVYRALINEEAAWRPAKAKFKQPWEWTVSAMRSGGISAQEPRFLARMLQGLGQKIWAPGSPAGFPDEEARWLAPDALIRRADAALQLATRHPGALDARMIADHAFQGELADDSRGAIAGASDPDQAFALFAMSPEFLWR